MRGWRKGTALSLLMAAAVLRGLAPGAEAADPDAGQEAPSAARCVPSEILAADPAASALAGPKRSVWSKHMKARARDIRELDRQRNQIAGEIDLMAKAATGASAEPGEESGQFSSLWRVDPVYDLRNEQILVTALLARTHHLQDQLAADQSLLACLASAGGAAPDWLAGFGARLADWQRQAAVTAIVLGTKRDRLAPIVAAVVEGTAPPPVQDAKEPKERPTPPANPPASTQDKAPEIPEKAAADTAKSAAAGVPGASPQFTPPPGADPSGRTLVSVIRFDAPNVDLAPGLRAALSQARRADRNVILVAVAPYHREEQTFLLARAAAQQYARSVGRALTGLGVKPERIYMASVTRSDVIGTEVRIYVQPSGEGHPSQ